ncbi:MAG TPA: hypothetical protein PLO33_04840, partial [Kouleothrix sp.]|nr:hypothetical protein [Kouleothrix sp.]
LRSCAVRLPEAVHGACGSKVLFDHGVRFFRTERGKTSHVQKENTALPKAKHTNYVTPKSNEK